MKVVFPGLGKIINSIRVCLQAFTVALEFSTGVVSNYKPLNAKTNLITLSILVNSLYIALMSNSTHVNIGTHKNGFGLQQALKRRDARPVSGNFKDVKNCAGQDSKNKL